MNPGCFNGLTEYYMADYINNRVTVHLHFLLEDLKEIQKILKKFDGISRNNPQILYLDGVRVSIIRVDSVLYGELASRDIINNSDIPYSYFREKSFNLQQSEEHVRFNELGNKVTFESSLSDNEKYLLSWKFQKEYRKRHKVLKLLMQ